MRAIFQRVHLALGPCTLALATGRVMRVMCDSGQEAFLAHLPMAEAGLPEGRGAHSTHAKAVTLAGVGRSAPIGDHPQPLPAIR